MRYKPRRTCTEKKRFPFTTFFRSAIAAFIGIIDISCPSDVNVEAKENEKMSKYGALRVEMGKMWDCECEVIPIVVGGLGAVSQTFGTYLKRIPAVLCKEMCQKITLLGSEKIMRSVLARK